MSCTFFVKQGDLTPALRAALTDSETGAAVDLSTAASASVRIRAAGSSTVLFERTANIVAPASGGIVEYPWQAGDTATAGDFYIEWVINYGGSVNRTYPTADYNLITVVPHL